MVLARRWRKNHAKPSLCSGTDLKVKRMLERLKNGGNVMCVLLSTISDSANIIMAAVAIYAGYYAKCAYDKSKQTFRHELMNDFFREYRSNEIGQSVKVMWDFWRTCGGSVEKFNDPIVKNKIVSKYGRHYDSKASSKVNSLHNHRRRISNFFQNIAILVEDDKEMKEIIYEVWYKRDLQIIPEIIVPIEMECLQKKINGVAIVEPSKYPKYMKSMIRLYDNAKDC